MNIEQLNLDIIGPDPSNWYSKVKPSKIVMIGKPGSGKSALLKYILFYFRHHINQGIIISSTEDISGDLGKNFPPLFIYNKYDEKPIHNLIAHQKQSIKNRVANPWSILVIEDCAFDRKFFNSTLQQELFKNSRHWYILYILTLQYVTDIPPVIRSTSDGCFMFKETNLNARKILYTNFASAVPSYLLFNELMDRIAINHTSLFFDNMRATDDWKDVVYYFKAQIIDRPWRFGNQMFWTYNKYYYDSSSNE